MTPQELFQRHLPDVERVVGVVCRHHHLPTEDAKDFASTVHLKLIEDDYGVLRKFRGTSEMSTFLTVVIKRLFLDYCNHLWGKWRPSKAAERLGPLAIWLEKLLVRDGYTLTEACRILQISHKVETSGAELEALAARLPMRVRHGREDEDKLASVPAGESSRADRRIWRQEHGAIRDKVLTSLDEALAELPAEDRLIIKMRTELPVVEIARALGLEVRPLYRRIERIHAALQAKLQRAGIRREDVREFFGLDLEEGGEPA